MRPYRILDMSDSHGGSCHGLTVPDGDGSWRGAEKWHYWQRLLHDWFFGRLLELGPYDLVVHKGETLDGPGKKSTLDLWTSDMGEQAEDAARVLAKIPRRKGAPILLCRASGYHSRGQMFYEEVVVKELKSHGVKDVSLKNHQRFEVHGVKFDAAHKVGGSRTAYAQGTQLQKAPVLDILRQWMKHEEPADVYLRGHNHYDMFLGNHMFRVYQTPCLEWPFGELSTEIDAPYYFVGFNHWEVWPDARGAQVSPQILKVRLPEDQYRRLTGESNGKG